MRLKKLMSLVLACAMMLSLVTVASAQDQDTKVYFAEDFSGYADQAQFGEKLVSNGLTKTASSGVPGGTTFASFRGSKTSASSAVFYDNGNNSAGYTIGSAERNFIINGFGNKALAQFTTAWAEANINDASQGGNSNSRDGSIYIMPKESWDFTADEHKGETYIISFDFGLDTNARGSQAQAVSDATCIYSWSGTTWANSDETSYITKRMFINYQGCNAPVPVIDEETGEQKINEYGRKVYIADSTIKMKANPNGNNYSGQDQELVSGNTYRIAYGFKFDETAKYNNAAGTGKYYEPVKIAVIDGKPWGGNNSWLGEKTQKTDNTGKHDGFSTLDGFWFGMHSWLGENFGDIRMYTVKTNDFKAYAETETNVPVSQKTVRIKLSNPVAPSSFTADTKAAIVVKKNGVVMNSSEYAISNLKTVIERVGGEAYSYVDVTFANLEEATTYSVEFPDTITNEIATPLTQTAATFTTKLPDVKLMPLSIVGAESLVANNESVQAVKSSLVNNTTAPKNVALIYAVYTSAGQLADVVYVNESVEETAEIEVGLKLAAAGTLKAFAWDGMASLRPYTGTQQLTIAAAE